MQKLKNLLTLMQNYNEVFSDHIQYIYEITKIEKQQETESELLDRVFHIDHEKGQKHNGSLLQINDWEKLLVYIIQDWSISSIRQGMPLYEHDLSLFRDMKEARMKEKAGWRFGEPVDELVVKNPISDTFKKVFQETFKEPPIRAYQINSDPNYFYGVYWEDYLFEFDSFYINLSFCLVD